MSDLKWQHTQSRFIWMVPLSDDDKVEEFANLIEEIDWSYGTACQYWSAFIKATEACGYPITLAMRVQSKILKALKHEEDPKRPTIPIQRKTVSRVITTLQEHGAQLLALAVDLAFALGQRMGDVLRLEAGQMQIIVDTHSGVEVLGITLFATRITATSTTT
jgi:hypothetical protein